MVYILRRLIQSALILLGVSFITFFLLFVLPADPVRQIAGRSATAATVESIRHELGLDQPFLIQFAHYLGGLFQGDLGRSYLQKSEVSVLIWSRLPATLLLMVAAIFCELVIGLSMGIIAALRRDRLTDQALMMTSFVTVSAPQFVVSLPILLLSTLGPLRPVKGWLVASQFFFQAREGRQGRRLRRGGPDGCAAGRGPQHRPQIGRAHV